MDEIMAPLPFSFGCAWFNAARVNSGPRVEPSRFLGKMFSFCSLPDQDLSGSNRAGWARRDAHLPELQTDYGGLLPRRDKPFLVSVSCSAFFMP
jgi:hypothetical protein